MLDDKSITSYHVKHDYLYGTEIDTYSFFRIPKTLFEHPLYAGMSVEAKLLYGCFLDRASLSNVNEWKDNKGRIFIIFQFEDIKRILGCSNQKVSKVLAELETDYDLIIRKKQGASKPNLIYVKRILKEKQNSDSQNSENQNSNLQSSTKAENRATELLNSELQSFGKQSTGTTKNGVLELRKSESNNTNINKTNMNNTEPTSSDNTEDEEKKRIQYEKYFKENLCVEQLVEEYPDKKEILYEIVDVIMDAMCTNSKTIRIAKDNKSRDVVHSQFIKLNDNHIRYVLDVLENSSNVRNMKQYILTTLYNSAMTIKNYISSKKNNGNEKEETKVAEDHFGYFSSDTKNRQLLDAILSDL